MIKPDPIKWITPYDGVPVNVVAAWFSIIGRTAENLIQYGDEKYKTEFLEMLVSECDAVLATVEEGGA